MSKFVLFIALLLAFSFSEEELTSGSTVDDNLKASGRVGDLMTTVEQMQKAKKAYNDAMKAKAAAEAGKKLLEEKKLPDVKGALTGMVNQYKSSKSGFVSRLQDIISKTSNALSAATKRVNMWRTTEPTLLSYGDKMKRMANNTVEVFSDFRPGDLVDIDREWSRKVGETVNADKSLVMSFKSYLDHRHRSLSIQREVIQDLFIGSDIQKELSSTEEGLEALLEMPTPHSFRQLPTTTLAFASDAIHRIREINSGSYGPSKHDGSMTTEGYDFDQIESVINNNEQTMEDTKNLSALIAEKRTQVQIQNTNINQITTMLEAKYARLLLRPHEKRTAQVNKMNKTMKHLISGGEIESIDEHRQRVFGKTRVGE